MPANKKHHYVPKFYLKQFSVDGLSINLFNFRLAKAINNGSLKNQCYRDYMYGEDATVEHALGDLEAEFAVLIRKICTIQLLPPPMSTDHQNLSLFIALQYGRTAHFADTVNEFTDTFYRNILKHEKSIDQDLLENVKIESTDPARMGIFQTIGTYPLIMDMDYKVLIAGQNFEFITSDTPVVMQNPLMSFRKFASNTGLSSKGLQIFVPLSPRVCLLYFDYDVYSVANRRSIVVNVDIKSDIDQINSLQVASAYENTYFYSYKADIYRVVELGKRHRRKRKTSSESFPEPATSRGRAELISFSREDVRTDLNLSFVSIKKRAKKWRIELQSLEYQPASIDRHPQLTEAFRSFWKLVGEGKEQATDFFEYYSTYTPTKK